MAFIKKILGFGGGGGAEPVYPTSGDPSAKLQLLSFPPIAESHVSGTPFGGKIEVALRLAGLEYEAYNGNVQDATVAPKKKFPVLWHGGKPIPDSSAIFEYLLNTYPDQMAVLTPADAKAKAVGHAVQRMLEEHSYFAVMYMLWKVDPVWAEYGPIVFKDVPPLMRGAISSFVRSSVLRDLYGQGVGRHSLAEVRQRLAKDLDTCCALLEETGEYLTGATPCQADCFLFALVDSTLNAFKGMKAVPGHYELVTSRQPLVDFHKRLAEKTFPEGTESCWKEGMWTPKTHL
eukprot:jgi/Ulvmu1/12791/UM097_0018.1